MERKIFVILAAVLLSSTVVLAWGEKKDVKKAAPAAAQAQATTNISAQQEKDALIANISNMRNQELRVAVLGQLLNEEIAKLRQVQEAFCAKYKLDVEKFRQGLYRYDEQQGKFVEIPAAPPAAGTPAQSQ